MPALPLGKPMTRYAAFLPETRTFIFNRWRGACARCGSPASDYAHRRPRGVRDAHTACSCNALALCRVCHSWCHKNPVAAAERGLTLSRYEAEPWTVPVQTIFGEVVLGCLTNMVLYPKVK